MSKRLEVLKRSLGKKEQAFNERLANHFADVKKANGQPLNDNRNGAATMRRWEKQNDALRNLEEGIQKTKAAIEKETDKIAGVNIANRDLPEEILKLVEAGELVQWRRHPNTFFVPGVDKARIVWDVKKQELAHRYASSITSREQWAKFTMAFNELSAKLKK